MYSFYFRDPLGQFYELACYKFDPPVGATHTDVLFEAHKLWMVRQDEHLADAIALLTQRARQSLSTDHSAKNPYAATPPLWG